jgi:hypothetical protein
MASAGERLGRIRDGLAVAVANKRGHLRALEGFKPGNARAWPPEAIERERALLQDLIDAHRLIDRLSNWPDEVLALFKKELPSERTRPE